MNKVLGLGAVLAALVVMLSGVMAQDPAKGKAPDAAAQPPAGGGKGGGKGGFGKGALTSVENFLTKYDTNNDKKVTKKEYMDVSTKDAEDQWKAIASDKSEITDKEIQTYIDANPPAFGGKAGAGGFGKMMGGGKGKGKMGG